MTRGFVWAQYLTDDGRAFKLQVDADSAADPARGWLDTTGMELVPLPRTWRPRVVIGQDEVGFIREARVGSVDADLWTGSVQEFTIEGSDGQLHTCVLIGRAAERLGQ